MVTIRTDVPLKLLDSFLRIPEIYKSTRDDFYPDPKKVSFLGELENEGVLKFSLVTEKKLVGVIFYNPISSTTLEIAVASLKPYRGKELRDNILTTLQWIFSQTNCCKVFCKIPADNLAAIGMARACRFHYEGRLSKAVYRNETLEDFLFYGVERDVILIRN